MLAAVAIVVTLLALLLPALGKIRKSAYLTSDLSSMRQLGSAMLSYAGNHANKINQVSTSNPIDKWHKWPEYFWTRAAPYLSPNILEGNLTVAKPKSAADPFTNKTLATMDTRYLGNSPGGNTTTRVIHPFAFNTSLFDWSAPPGGGKGVAMDHFRRLSDFPYLSTTPYIAVGKTKFLASTPGPMPDPSAITDGIF